MSQATTASKSVPIVINGKPFRVDAPILGATLRELGNLPAENQLFEERPGPDPDVLIDPATSYTPKPGTHYYDLPRGTVGADRQAQLDHATRHLAHGRADSQPDESVVLRWKASLPD